MINTQKQQYETKTHFGHSISFPKGIIGFDGLSGFALEPLFEDKTTNLPFLRLQAKGQATNFVVMPMGTPYGNDEPHPFKQADIDPWMESLGIEKNKATIFTLVSIKDDKGEPNVTANMRAPIIIDSESMNAWQIILDNPAYDIAYKLNVDS